jgi:hypothetical protein
MFLYFAVGKLRNLTRRIKNDFFEQLLMPCKSKKTLGGNIIFVLVYYYYVALRLSI